MLISNQLTGFGAGGGVAAATIEFTESEEQAGDSSPYTFSNKAYGAAASNRTVIVSIAAHLDGSGLFTAVTIDGVSATEIVQASDSSMETAIWAADVPTGVSGDIVVTCSGSPNRCSIGVWAAYGIGAADDTAVDIAEAFSQALTISAGGVAVAVSINNHATATASWGVSMTERFEGTMESTRHSGADASGEASATVAVTWSTAGATANMCAAAWPVG